MNLYELTDQYLRLLEMADDPEVDEQTFLDTLEAIDGEIEAKADGYAMVMRQLSGYVDVIKTEEARLKKRRTCIENNIERMKKRLQESMEATGKLKFQTDFFSFGIQKNPQSVAIDCSVYDLPEDYLRYKEPEPDKKALVKALQSGEQIDGVRLVQTQSLRIR